MLPLWLLVLVFRIYREGATITLIVEKLFITVIVSLYLLLVSIAGHSLPRCCPTVCSYIRYSPLQFLALLGPLRYTAQS